MCTIKKLPEVIESIIYSYLMECSICNKFFDDEYINSCKSCDLVYCEDCGCDDLIDCDGCSEKTCNDCFHECDSCNEKKCDNCTVHKMCKSCNGNFCDSDECNVEGCVVCKTEYCCGCSFYLEANNRLCEKCLSTMCRLENLKKELEKYKK